MTKAASSKCIDCKQRFERPSRGRPPLRCVDCREEARRKRKREARKAKPHRCVDCGTKVVREGPGRKPMRCGLCAAEYRRQYRNAHQKRRYGEDAAFRAMKCDQAKRWYDHNIRRGATP